MDVEVWRNEEYQSKPVLYVRGSDGGHRSIVREENSLENTCIHKGISIDKAKHMIQIMNLEDLAEGLADFFANLPIWWGLYN
jgi:hypothetical protein